VDESESPAFEDSKLTVPDPFPPAEGFVLISPDGSYAWTSAFVVSPMQSVCYRASGV
jgi:hypothetical protein